MQINNGNENIDISSKLAKKITKSEVGADENNTVNKAIFESWDLDGNGELSTSELADGFTRLDENGDGVVTDDEINTAVDKIENVKQAKKAEYVQFLKEMAAKNAEKVADDANVGNVYTVQLGEQFDDLIMRIMKAQGADYTNEAEVEKYKKQFIADNDDPSLIKKNADGSVKWLMAGAKVHIRTGSKGDNVNADIKDQDNQSDVLSALNDWESAGRKETIIYNANNRGSYVKTKFNYSQLEEADLKGHSKESVKSNIKSALKILDKLNDYSNYKKIEDVSDTQKKITLSDDTYVVVQLDKDGNITQLWVDIDGEKGSDGKTHTDVMFGADGTLKLNMDNDGTTDITLKNSEFFNFDNLKKNIEDKATSDIVSPDKIDNSKNQKGKYTDTEIANLTSNANNFLKTLVADDAELSITKNGNKKTFKFTSDNGASITLKSENGLIKEVWIDFDGVKGDDGKPHADVMYGADGQIRLNFQNKNKADIISTGGFDFDSVLALIDDSLSKKILAELKEE